MPRKWVPPSIYRKRHPRKRWPKRTPYRYTGLGSIRRAGYYGRFTGPTAEYKYLDTIINDATTNTLRINPLCPIPVGTDPSERIGRKVVIKKISLRMTISLLDSGTIASTGPALRLMLVQDTQTNGAQFGATDLLETNGFSSFNSLVNSGRFKTLKTWYYTFMPPPLMANEWVDDNLVPPTPRTIAVAGFDNVLQSKWLNFTKNVDIPLEYDGALGAITEVRSNNIYFCYISNVNGGCEVVGTVRLRYSDR